MTRVAIRPEMWRWARERAGVMSVDELLVRFPKFSKYAEWEIGDLQPTLKQVGEFAKAVHVPVGYLFLPAPPDEPLPIPDFRTHNGKPLRKPSPDLLDMIYACQERQSWYREFVTASRIPDLAFIGSATVAERPETVAAAIADKLGFDLAARAASRNWEEAFKLFVEQAEKIGVMVMVSGIVLSNTHRKLDAQEFRGFALADNKAPLVFINGSDSKSGQMFTLAHELAHLWLGSSAISNSSAAPLDGHRREEVWCNAVAAELLVPLNALQRAIKPNELPEQMIARLTRHFKVSTLVILRRLLDAGIFTRPDFDLAWAREQERLRGLDKNSPGGGNFYATTLVRVGRRFARALVESTLEGQTLYRDAFRMLGVTKTETFNTLGHEVGAMI